MSAPPPRTGGMSGLYANLLGDTSPAAPPSATISKAPVVFSKSGSPPGSNRPVEDGTSLAQKKINAAALRFQPTIAKRPVPAQKKAGINFKPIAVASTTTTTAATTPKNDDAAPALAKPVVKTTLEDWVGDDEDVNGFYAASSKERQRAGRKKRKKNRATPPPPTNWDDVYDPLKPNSYEEYKEGDEKIREMEDWRDRLYGKRRRGGFDESSESEDDRRPIMRNRFAPPTNYSFAPPPQFTPGSEDNNPPHHPPSNIPPPPPVEVPDDVSGEDAFARRMRMSQQGAVGYSVHSQQPAQTYTVPLPPPPPPLDAIPTPSPVEPTPLPPPPPADATISRAPVIYQQPAPSESRSPPPPKSASPEPSEPSSRPGQPGFAKRLLEKQGWKAGQGLGRDGKGITKAIQMVSSGKKNQAGRGKIVDKNKPRVDKSTAERSEVVLMRGIIDGKREEYELPDLLQMIGDQYKRYGRVVQIVIRWEEDGSEKARVYVLFADQGSAQMAVNGLQRREIFEGNRTVTEFYPREKFDASVFE